MQQEEIKKILASLNPNMSLVTDPNAKSIIDTLSSVIDAQQKTIDELTEKFHASASKIKRIYKKYYPSKK